MSMQSGASVLRNRLRTRGRFRHMQAFVEVARVGSTQKAAAQMGLTQPAVTHLLAELEKLVDARLFVRHAKGMRLTDAGALLLPAARRILDSVDESAWQAAAVAQRTRAYIRLSAQPAAASGLLATHLCSFNDHHPDVLLDVREAAPMDITTHLKEGSTDLALCRATQSLPIGWAFEPLIPDRYVILAGSSHPLVNNSKVTVQALRQHPWITLPPGSGPRTAFEQFFLRDNPQLPPIVNIVSTSFLMIPMLLERPWLTLIPLSVATSFVRAGLLRPIRIRVDMEIAALGMVTRQEPLDGAVLLLRDFLRDAVSSSEAL